METQVKYICGAAAAALSFFSPAGPLILCALAFVAIDFATGVAASRKRAVRSGREWAFESAKAWNTVVKAGFVMGGIVLAWLIDTQILHFMGLRLANLFTGFVCGVEFWSYLENAAEISQHPMFRKLNKYMKSRIEKELEK